MPRKARVEFPGAGANSTSFLYDDLNRVTLCDQRANGSSTYFSRNNYNDYDLVNNLKSISREEDGNTGELFVYDYANQLSSVSYKADVTPHAPGGAPGGTIAGVEGDEDREALAALEADPVREPLAEGGGIDAQAGPRTVTYTNDAINRLSMTDSGAVTYYTPNHLNQYTSVTSHGSLTYDGNLNVSGYDGWSFVHDAEKRLLSVTRPGHSAMFVYDGLGRCVKRTIDGATVVLTYDNWKPIVEWEWHTGAARLVAWNLYGPGADEILVRNQPNTGGYLYYHLDPMGNVQFLLSNELLGLEKYTYDVFGKPTIIGWQNGDVRPISSYGNRFLFTGREYLYTFGLYDYRHRIYHPGLGRFIETDPLGLQIEGAKLSSEQTALYPEGGAPGTFSSSELNLYRYCHNDPVNNLDPTGLETLTRPETDEQVADRVGALGARVYREFNHIVSSLENDIRNDPEGVLGVALSVASRGRINANRLKPIVIGENMKDRVIPLAKEIGAAFYRSRTKNPANWLRNNIRWFKDKLRQDRKIIDIGRDPNRKERSPYYEAEKKVLEERKKK